MRVQRQRGGCPPTTVCLHLRLLGNYKADVFSALSPVVVVAAASEDFFPGKS